MEALSQCRCGKHGPVCTASFFGLYWLYVCLRIEPTLIYHGHVSLLKFPGFFLDWAFVEDLLVCPGGLAECLSAFLSQFYYYSWAGALVITLIGWLFYLSVGAFVRAFTGRDVYLLRFAAAVGLLLAYNQYIHCLEGSIKILLALLFALVYIKISLLRGWTRWTVFLLLSALLYCGAGTGGLLFAWFCVMFEIRRRRFITALWCFVSTTVAAYILANYFLDSNPSRMWLIFPEVQTFEDPRIAKVVVWSYLVFALVVVVLTFWPRRQASTVKKNKTAMAGEESSSGNAKLRLILSVFVLLAMSVTIFFSLNRVKRYQSQITYYGYYRKWPELLRLANGIPFEEYNIFLVHYVNRALFHTGKLGCEMFSYPQSPDAFGAIYKGSRNCVATEQFFEIGLVNDAAHLAYQSLERFGSYPMTLKQLALINVAREQTNAARVFLNVLSKDLIFGRWARDCLKRLETDPLLLEDERMRRISTLRTVDDPLRAVNLPGMQLQILLEHNGENKMAFEYLMADHLLNRRLEMFLGQLHRLDDFDYPDIPRHYEEAILIYTMLTKKTVDLGNRKINPETIRRSRDFYRICAIYGNNTQAALEELERMGFSDTYFFYYSFQ